jgi:RimJ/RimL family protein N-acetyltransferase
MLNARETVLRQASDEDFQWMLDGEPASRGGLRLPPGGVDDPSILTHVREITKRVQAQGCSGTWMIVCNDEVVGLCGYHAAPTNGEVEIGYSVAASRRRRGHATLAVAAMIAEALSTGVRALKAETSTSNRASNRVLENNGFVQGGTRVAADDCEILTWQKRL